jgi:hypothetical protein
MRLRFRYFGIAVVLASAITFAGCEGGSSKLFITPSSQPFTFEGQTKKFVIEVEGPAKVKISNTELTDPEHFQFVGGGGLGECLGEYVEEGKPCTEEIKLSKSKSGLDAKFKVTPQVGAIAESTLTTP